MTSYYFFFFFRFLSRQQHLDQCFAGHKSHYWSQPQALDNSCKVEVPEEGADRCRQIRGSQAERTFEWWALPCQILGRSELIAVTRIVGFVERLGSLWGLGRCRSPVLTLWQFVGIGLPLSCRIPHSTRAKVQRGAREKTIGRCRGEGVEARICVRLAGARPDVVRSGCSINSLYMCFGWVNSLTQHRGQTDFLLQAQLMSTDRAFDSHFEWVSFTSLLVNLWNWIRAKP